jgi:hypothetical protein
MVIAFWHFSTTVGSILEAMKNNNNNNSHVEATRKLLAAAGRLHSNILDVSTWHKLSH